MVLAVMHIVFYRMETTEFFLQPMDFYTELNFTSAASPGAKECLQPIQRRAKLFLAAIGLVMKMPIQSVDSEMTI